MMKIIEVEGKPIPLQRVRAGKKGFYDPQYIAKRNYAHLVREQYKDDPIETAVSVTFEFYFAMPKSWSKKKKNAMRYKEHTQKPDLSNLIKFAEDALLEVIWKDDSIINEIFANKTWEDKGKTIMKVYKWNIHGYEQKIKFG